MEHGRKGQPRTAGGRITTVQEMWAVAKLWNFGKFFGLQIKIILLKPTRLLSLFILAVMDI